MVDLEESAEILEDVGRSVSVVLVDRTAVDLVIELVVAKRVDSETVDGR